jgi:hypothetical protein
MKNFLPLSHINTWIKSLLIFTVLGLASTVTSQPAFASPYGSVVSRCFLRSTSQAERLELMKFSFILFADHPAFKSIISATPDQKDKINEKVAMEAPSQITINKIVGKYRVVLDPKLLDDAKKEGVKSVTGIWIIKSDGTFEAILKAVSIRDEVQEITTTGKITIEYGKVVSQVETVNGEKLDQTPPKQLYTLSSDGKELQADDQPVKLIKQ